MPPCVGGKAGFFALILPATPTLLWFRRDLRLEDNPALAAARARGGPIIPVYVADDESEGDWAPGGASRWWLHHSLAALDASLRRKDSRLVLARGPSGSVLSELIAATGATAVYWNRRYEPAVIARDAAIKKNLVAQGVEVKSFNGSLLFEPHTIANKQGDPFQVFTAYWRHCQTRPVAEPEASAAKKLTAPPHWPASLSLADLALLPKLDWAAGIARVWTPGEAGAQERLKAFVAQTIENYDGERDRPANAGTSRLSPHLHFGEIGPRQVWAAVKALGRSRGVFPSSNGARVFLTEIGWREFAHHLLFHFPDTPRRPLRRAFEQFAWAEDPGGVRLEAWRRGLTGYPIVDAGMRELWATGWMHNRVRMITASFLVKHLRLPWNAGAAWFWETLVDADLAANTLGWQWSAGCGADAAPYFRIFAPVLQGGKFDADGAYVRRWLPELAAVPDRFLHAPWTAPAHVLVRSGVELGATYPRPIVDHAEARAAALAAFNRLRSGRGDIPSTAADRPS